MRLPTARATSTQSSMVAPDTGTNGQTSVAPKRACSPSCTDMSISSAAFCTARNAASATGSGSPMKVTTVRLVLSPGSTSSSSTPCTASTASVISLMTDMSRPSEKLGTHSMTFFMAYARWRVHGGKGMSPARFAVNSVEDAYYPMF